MATKDYYNSLGIPKNASKDEIKTAFRRLAHQYHPDKGGQAEKFKEINEAYQILSDDKKRAEYDTYGSTFGDMPHGFGQGQGFGQGFEGFDFSGFQNATGGFEGVEFDLGDVFGDLFRGGGGKKRVRRGRDIAIDVEIPFKESIFGTERKVLIPKTILCNDCGGTGAKAGAAIVKCSICNGQGKVHDTKRTIFGTFSTERECDTCLGRGEVPKEKCHACRGAGVLKGQEEIHVIIPPGIKDGEMIRFSGKGEAVAKGGIAGDLYAKVHVTVHKIFHREGNNLIMTLDIKLSDALLGAEYNITTLDDGKLQVKIPEGISHGEILRVRDKGIPYDRTNRGDLLIKINLKLPKKLSKKAREAIEALKEEGV